MATRKGFCSISKIKMIQRWIIRKLREFTPIKIMTPCHFTDMPDFRPRTQSLRQRPGPQEERLYNSITCVHSNYPLRTSPQETMVIDTGNYTGKGGKFRLLRHLKMSDTRSELIQILEDFKYDHRPL